MGFFNLISSTKQSFPEGVKLSSKEHQLLLKEGQSLFNLLVSFYNSNLSIDKLALKVENETDSIKNVFTKLQNSIDRTILSKETLRAIINHCYRKPAFYRFIILQNIHLINNQVAASLLKFLEEPPPNHTIILITDSLPKVNPIVINPLLSRCLAFNFTELSLKSQKKILLEHFYLQKLPTIYNNWTFTLKHLMKEKYDYERLKNTIKNWLINNPTTFNDNHLIDDINYTPLGLINYCRDKNITLESFLGILQDIIQSILNQIWFSSLSKDEREQKLQKYIATSFPILRLKLIVKKIKEIQILLSKKIVKEETLWLKLIIFLKKQ